MHTNMTGLYSSMAAASSWADRLKAHWRSSVKAGDLVRYRHYHNNLQTLRGVVIRLDRTNERAKILWNRPECNDEVFDWVEDLEIIDATR